jgi:hypothetical protein
MMLDAEIKLSRQKIREIMKRPEARLADLQVRPKSNGTFAAAK